MTTQDFVPDACSTIRVGDTVMTGNGPRVVTQIGSVHKSGRRYWEWSWKPDVPKDGRIDCGYSGIWEECAADHFVLIRRAS